MTAIRHTATLTEWNGEQGIAQTDSGEQYPVTRAQLYYAPYTVGSRIQIYVENGEVVDGGLIPIAGEPGDEWLTQQPIAEFKQSIKWFIAIVLLKAIVISLLQGIIFSSFRDKGSKHIIPIALIYLPCAILMCLMQKRCQITCTQEGIIMNYGGMQFLAWRDISHTETRRVPIFRLPYLLVHSKNNQPALRINLFLLTPKQRNELQTLIQSHIQAA